MIKSAITVCLIALSQNIAFAMTVSGESAYSLQDIAFNIFFRFIAPLFFLCFIAKLSSSMLKGSISGYSASNRRRQIETVPIKDPDNFLNDYKEIKISYLDIKSLDKSIQASDMTKLQKGRGTELTNIANLTIDKMRSLHILGKVSPENVMKAYQKLDEVKAKMLEIIDGQTMLIASGFDEIKIPDTYARQEKLEQLRGRGKNLLNRIDDDEDFDGTETKTILSIIVNKRIDEAWDEYLAAKNSYINDNEEGVFTLHNSKETTPEMIIDEIFNEIELRYDKIEAGLSSLKQNIAMTELMATKAYFERR